MTAEFVSGKRRIFMIRFRGILMNQNFQAIRDGIKRDATVFSNRQRLKNMLNDLFPNDKLHINLLMTAYDENIGDYLSKFSALNDSLLKQFNNKLIQNYGVSEENAQWAVIAWYKIFNREINITQKKSASTSTKTKPPATSIPAFGTGNSTSTSNSTSKGAVAPKNSAQFDLLKRLYRQNFNSPKWAFGDENFSWAYTFCNADDKWSPMPNDTELYKLALNVVCHGKYSENDIIHLRIDRGCSFGLALTYESLCTSGKFGDHIFNYSIIPSGEECIRNILEQSLSMSEVSLLRLASRSFLEQRRSMYESSLGRRLSRFLDAAKKIVSPSNYSTQTNPNKGVYTVDLDNLDSNQNFGGADDFFSQMMKW